MLTRGDGNYKRQSGTWFQKLWKQYLLSVFQGQPDILPIHWSPSPVLKHRLNAVSITIETKHMASTVGMMCSHKERAGGRVVIKANCVVGRIEIYEVNLTWSKSKALWDIGKTPNVQVHRQY